MSTTEPKPSTRAAAVRPGRVGAEALGRLAGRLSRGLRLGSGAAVAGKVALRLDDQLIGRLAGELRDGSLVVSGTNGKTSTSAMIVRMVASSGAVVAANPTGANLANGVLGALLYGLPGDVGVLEVDEAAAVRVVPQLHPRVMVLTNVFRDQLDRYGEVEQVLAHLTNAAAQLPEDATLVVNADDPGLVAVAQASGRRLVYYGLAEGRPGMSAVAADSAECRMCGEPLAYRAVYLGHLGDFECPSCGWKRPELDIAVRPTRLRGLEPLEAEVRTDRGVAETTVQSSGLHTAYNLGAAIGGAMAMGIAPSDAARAVAGMSPPFGRGERIDVGGTHGALLLMKNPAGGNELVCEIVEEGIRQLLVSVCDRTPDGIDVSWIWDVEFEALAGHVDRIVTSGTRAWDIAVRLKYAGLDVETVEENPRRALQDIASNGPFAILATYSGMLDLRRVLRGRRGKVAA